MVKRCLTFRRQHRIVLRRLGGDQLPIIRDVLRNPVRMAEDALNERVDRILADNLRLQQRCLRVRQVRLGLPSLTLQRVRGGDRRLAFLQRCGLMLTAHNLVRVEFLGRAALDRVRDPVLRRSRRQIKRLGLPQLVQLLNRMGVVEPANERHPRRRPLRLKQVPDEMLRRCDC